MFTSFDTIIESFLKWVEKDVDFFYYFNLTDDEAINLAKSRAMDFLFESIGKLTLECSPQVNFYDYSSDEHRFNFQLLNKEIYLLSSLMYERYLDRDFSKLKLYNVNFSSADLNVFDPSNARKTFLNIYEKVEVRNKQLIDDYKSRDRLTGKLRGLDYNDCSI